MKRALLAFAVMLASARAGASPYFRPLNPAHAKPIIGALLAPEALGQSSAAGLLPLVTHSPKDGCLLPSIVCEDWTPLAVGASMNAGKITFDVAPLANVLPWMQRAADAALPESWSAARRILTPSQGAVVTFSAGPVFEYKQATNKGYFRVFTGLALQF